MSLLITMVCAVILTAVLWIWPQAFLALYNFNHVEMTGFAINALKLFSFYFILSVIPNMLVFYYEAIERPIFSSFISVLFTLVLPLATVVGLYHLIGPNGMWIGFSISCIFSMIVIVIGVKLIQRRESKYSGLFFVEEDLVHKTKNFVLTDNDLNARKECLNHLKDLNADDVFCDNVNKIFDVIFDTNEPGTYVEILVIDYPDNIHVDIKYDGEQENLEHLKHNFPENLFKFAEVLGFNTVEYVMDK